MREGVVFQLYLNADVLSFAAPAHNTYYVLLEWFYIITFGFRHRGPAGADTISSSCDVVLDVYEFMTLFFVSKIIDKHMRPSLSAPMQTRNI